MEDHICSWDRQDHGLRSWVWEEWCQFWFQPGGFQDFALLWWQARPGWLLSPCAIGCGHARIRISLPRQVQNKLLQSLPFRQRNIAAENIASLPKHHAELRDGVFFIGGNCQAVLVLNQKLMTGARKRSIES